VSDDAQLIDLALKGKTEAFGQLVLKYQEPAVQYGLPRGWPLPRMPATSSKRRWFRRSSQLDSFRRPARLHLAVPHRLQRGHYPSAATPADRVDGSYAGSQSYRTRRLRRRSGRSPGPPRSAAARCGRQLPDWPEEHRAVLVLREIDGCCYETISEILNLPIGTVRSRLHRARCN